MGTLFHYHRKSAKTYGGCMITGIIYTALGLLFLVLVVIDFIRNELLAALILAPFLLYGSYCFISCGYLCFEEAQKLKKKE